MPLATISLHARGFFTLPEKDRDQEAAFRMLIGVALPTLALIALGRSDLTIYAVFGAFTGMYGRDESHRRRATHQLGAAAFLFGCVGLGVVVSATELGTWWLVGIETAVAGAGSLVADRLRLRPVGPFFGLFAFGACASVPLTNEPWVPLYVAASAAATSVLVGLVAWAGARGGTAAALPDAPSQPHPAEMLPHAGRYMLAVGVAGSIAALAGLGHPYWAMASAAVPLAAVDLTGRVSRGVHRILGTYAGLVVAAGILYLHPNPIVLALLVIALQFPTEFFMTRHYALALVSFTPLIVVMTYLAHPMSRADLIADRAAETTIGALVGIALVLTLHRSVRKPTDAVASV